MSQTIIQTHSTNFQSESHDCGTASAQSSAFTFNGKKYAKCRIAVTGDVHIKFGTNPTATVEDFLITAGDSEIFRFRSGDKVAFIKEGSSCTINITILD